MNITIKSSRTVGGSIAAPPSKSMAHRAVLCAALAKGTSHLHHLAFSKDISATLGAAGRLCARVTTGENDAVVEGLGRFLPVDAPVDCCESGSTLRFLIPLASLTGQEVTFTGRGRLMERPQSVYKTLYQQQGLRFEQGADRLTVEGALTPGEYELAGNVSSHQRAAVCPAPAGRHQHSAPHPARGEPELHRYDPRSAARLWRGEPLAG